MTVASDPSTERRRVGLFGDRVTGRTQLTARSSLALRSKSVPGVRNSGPLLRGPLAVWAALWLNVLAFLGPSIIPIPRSLGQLISQTALLLALFLALLANPAGIVRPNLVLILMSMMGLAAFLASLHSQFFLGSSYRGFRLVLFVIVLWMLSQWWGQPDLPLAQAHLTCLRVVLGSIVVGGLVFWPVAHADQGRLSGIIWPIPPPQVAHYAAMLLGCTAVFWFTRVVSNRAMAYTFVACMYCLIDSHTRTALAAVLVGLLIAGASLFIGHARVRRTAAFVTVLFGFVIALFAPYLVAWLSRGQSAQDASQLTGRTKVWSQVINEHRPVINLIFGNGLSDKSYNGLPVDSNWVATYLDTGLFGAALIVAFLLVVILMALTRPRGPRRALALFIVTYCIVASFTETGLGDASPYLLDIVVAGSVLAKPARDPVR